MRYLLKSLLGTNVLYDGGAEYKAANLPAGRVELKPGLNELSPADVRVLAYDKHFQKHLAGSFYIPVNDDGGVVELDWTQRRNPEDTLALDHQNINPAPNKDVPDADARIRREGESLEDHLARVAAWEAQRRGKLAKESDKAHAKRTAGYDADNAAFYAEHPEFAPAPAAAPLTADQEVFLSDYYTLPEADRSAYYGTLSDAEKALVDANPAA